MTPKQKREAIENLVKSDGWAVLREEMEKAILLAAYQISDNGAMPIDEVHFRRGSMWAARKFIELPDNVSRILANDILMDAAAQGEVKPERYGPQQP